jgi:hypothetical protein
MFFFIIATERLHVKKDILQIRLIIFTDKYEKKIKRAFCKQPAPLEEPNLHKHFA